MSLAQLNQINIISTHFHFWKFGWKLILMRFSKPDETFNSIAYLTKKTFPERPGLYSTLVRVGAIVLMSLEVLSCLFGALWVLFTIWGCLVNYCLLHSEYLVLQIFYEGTKRSIPQRFGAFNPTEYMGVSYLLPVFQKMHPD